MHYKINTGELCRANKRITNLETFIFELCDDRLSRII